MANLWKTMFGPQQALTPMDQMRRMMMVQQMGNLGAGLMQAGGPVPFGQSRGGMFGQALQSAMPDPRAQMAMMQMQQQQAQQQRRKELGERLAQAMAPPGQVMAAGGPLTPMQEALRAGEFGLAAQLPKMMGQGTKAPRIEEFPMPGGMVQKRQWNQTTSAWEDVGKPYPRWQPRDPLSRGAAAKGTGGYFEFKDPETGEEVQAQAYFDPKQRQFFYRGKEGQELPVPFGAKKVTPSSEARTLMQPSQLHKMRTEVYDTERGVKQLYRYLENVKGGREGFDVLADQWTAKIKTMLGKGGKLSGEEIATLAQTGQIQGLLGAFRKEVVGGGVMTEQDALRVLSALGGDVTSTRNKDVVAQLLRNILKDRINFYNEVLVPGWNYQAGEHPTYKTVQPLQLREDLFRMREPSGAGGMSDDELLRALGAGGG